MLQVKLCCTVIKKLGRGEGYSSTCGTVLAGNLSTKQIFKQKKLSKNSHRKLAIIYFLVFQIKAVDKMPTEI